MFAKRIAALVLAGAMAVTAFTGVSIDANAAGLDLREGEVVNTEVSVSPEMCNANYWKAQLENPNEILMDSSDIAAFNQQALSSPGTNMNDITNMDEVFDATKLAESLSQDVLTIASNKRIFVNGTEVNRDEYFNACAELILQTGFKGNIHPSYAVAVKRAELNAWPTDAYIGYSATDSDDEATNSALNINEPFLIKQQCIYNGEVYYFGYTNNCSGWLNAKDVAICSSKQEWLNAWQTSITGKDFIVVTESAITLDKDVYLPYVNNVKLTFGTVLKLVPEDKIPNTLAERGTWHNYVVYIPTRDENGRYVPQMALISQNKSVSVGYLPMTQANIIDVAFACLGDRYGWGGSLDAMDCSLYTRTVYKCFGLEIPRNTSWQQKVAGTFVDASQATDQIKLSFLQSVPAGTLLYFPGHTMIYLGTVNGRAYCISALGSVASSTGDVSVQSINSVAITPLDVRRRSGITWLTAITGIVSPSGF